MFEFKIVINTESRLKELLEQHFLSFIQHIRVFYLVVDKQISTLRWHPILRHTFINNFLNFIRLSNLPSFFGQLNFMAVQMLDLKIKS